MFHDSEPFAPEVTPGLNYAEASFICDVLNLNHGENGEIVDRPATFRPALRGGGCWGFRIENAEPGGVDPEISAEGKAFILGYAEGMINAVRTMARGALERVRV